VGEGRSRDQTSRQQAREQSRPGLRRVHGLAAQPRRDLEGETADRCDRKPCTEQEIHAPAVDREPRAGEHGDGRGGHADDGLEHEPRLRQRIGVLDRGMREEQGRRGPEQQDDERQPDEPARVRVGARSHVPLIGSAAHADEGGMAERILLVDDHPLTREALSSLLAQHDFDVVGEASDGLEAIELAEQLHPELVLLDLSMPGMGGLEALPKLRAAAPDCEVVVLTASGTEENLLAAIRAGAAGYLLKSEPPGRIVEFLRGAANGEAALSGSVARRLLDQVRTGARRGGGVPDHVAKRLSAREVEVLLLLDEHLSTDDIAKRLYISEHTVRSHVKSLLRKLGVSSRREALEQLADAG
jgi:DNA-binding NarL/FixJ family response regulator